MLNKNSQNVKRARPAEEAFVATVHCYMASYVCDQNLQLN